MIRIRKNKFIGSFVTSIVKSVVVSKTFSMFSFGFSQFRNQRRITLNLRILRLIFLLILLATLTVVPILIRRYSSMLNH